MMHFNDKGGPRVSHNPNGPRPPHQKLALAFVDMKAKSAETPDATVANRDKRLHPVFEKQQVHDLLWLL